MRIPYCLLRNPLLGLVCASFCFAEGDGKVVALTFDDGPNPPCTKQLLQALATNGVQATFFLIGDQVNAHPETARKIIAAVPLIIDALRGQGYSFLTVGDLLEH